VWALTACTIRPEYSVLDEFFAASKLRDTTALAKISLVILEPREAGTVGRLKIRSVSNIARAPLRTDDRVVRLSLLPVSDVSALSALTGEVETEQVVVAATLRTPDGRESESPLTVTLGRAALSPNRQTGRWIVTAVQGAATARALDP
jgi:hypothetical protein